VVRAVLIHCPAVLVERSACQDAPADTVAVTFPLPQIVYGMPPGWYEVSRTTDAGHRCVPFRRLVLRDGTLCFLASGPGTFRIANWTGRTGWLAR